MQELEDYAHRSPLAGLIFEPPRFLRPENGVTGVALAYDDLLVDEVARAVSDETPYDLDRGTIEFSERVAWRLARFATGERLEDPPYFGSTWRDLSRRRYDRDISPIVIEITVGPDFPKEHGEALSNFTFWENHRIVFRRAQRSILHFAEPGGRYLPDSAARSGARRWGTLGGFLDGGKSLYAVTAAHVADSLQGYGTPRFRRSDYVGCRSTLQALASIVSPLLPAPWAGERGTRTANSTADLIPGPQCDAAPQPVTTGLDTALVALAADSRRKLYPAQVAAMGQLSQALPLTFAGAKSGTQAVAIASRSIWHSYEMPGGQFACIAGCLQIKLRRRPYVRADVSQGGDSGAWLMAEGADEPHWLGLLVGGDGERAGVVPAQRILDHFNARLGMLRPMI